MYESQASGYTLLKGNIHVYITPDKDGDSHILSIDGCHTIYGNDEQLGVIAKVIQDHLDSRQEGAINGCC